MASLNRTVSPVSAVDRDVVLVPLRFGLGGSSPATSTFKGALLSTVTRSGAGTYAVTLTDGAYELLGALCSLELGATTTSLNIHVKSVDVAAKTLTVVTSVPASGAANDGATDDRANVMLVIKKSSVTTRRA